MDWRDEGIYPDRSATRDPTLNEPLVYEYVAYIPETDGSTKYYQSAVPLFRGSEYHSVPYYANRRCCYRSPISDTISVIKKKFSMSTFELVTVEFCKKKKKKSMEIHLLKCLHVHKDCFIL